ncbi:MAG: biotin/lipoyl-binding protein [Planctomycetaceae bacterium]|nr:biotin/lipoyl-binding protein [Planctomycetaceae bacterium]
MAFPLLQPPPCFLRWRDELIVTRAGTQEQDGYLIEDPVTGKFHRLGQTEYAIAMQLDGSRLIAEAAKRVSTQPGDRALEPAALESLERWLMSAGLVDALIQGQRRTLARPASGAAAQSILCYRWSWGNPDRWLRSVTPWLSWLFAWPVVVVGAVAMLVAAITVAMHGAQFTASLDQVWHADQHIRLLLCWIFLKVCHELGHGVACQRFGGDVRECGLTFMYFAPVPYVDVTSSWRMTSRWQRIAIAAAGMYVEWLIAAGAVGVWLWSTNSAVQQSAVYIASLASVATLLFNANPLFRFDGYFILTDLLDWPNLSAQGQLLSRAWFAQWWFGTPLPNVALSPRAKRIVTGYGIAAWCWRVMMMVSMSVLAVIMYDAVGVLLVGVTTVAGLIQPWFKRRQQLATLPVATTRHWGRFWTRLTLTAVVLVGLACVPWWGTVSAPGVVQPVDLAVVRTPCGGFVEQLEVVDGQPVVADQVLAVLSNDALRLELEQLEQSERLALVKLRSLRQRRELVEMQAEEGKLAALREQLADVRRRVAALTIRAPSAGKVIGRTLHDLPGSFLKEGAELCAIAGSELEVLVAIADQDISTFRDRLGTAIDVRLPSETRSGELRSLDPRASRVPHDRSLIAPQGGPLPATKVSQPADAPNAEPWELLRPHFVGRIALSANDEQSLGIGQRVTARFRPLDVSVFEHLWRGWQRWLDRMRSEHGVR